MPEFSQTGKSKRAARVFKQGGGFPARLKRKATVASEEYRQMRTPNEETHVAPLARGFRALRRVK